MTKTTVRRLPECGTGGLSMSKAVLISIRPEWVEKILNGEKTLEVRKTRPKLETPFKVYIYCTAGNLSYEVSNETVCNISGGKLVVGEFVCDKIDVIRRMGIPENFDYCYLSLNEWGNDDIETEIRAISASCVSKEELNAYGAKAPLLYGWHISDLRIYDAPRELSEFTGLRDTRFGAAPYDIKRAPQSWCYVEEG